MYDDLPNPEADSAAESSSETSQCTTMVIQNVLRCENCSANKFENISRSASKTTPSDLHGSYRHLSTVFAGFFPYGFGIRWLTRGLANLPQSNQEPVLVKDKVERLQVSWACRKGGVGLLVMMIWLELCTSYSSSCHQCYIILSSNNILNGDKSDTSLPGFFRKWLLNKCHYHIPFHFSQKFLPLFGFTLSLQIITAFTISSSVAEWLGTLDLRSIGRRLKPWPPAIECNPGQPVNTHVPLSPSSIIRYQPMGGDALQLGR